MMLPSDGWVIHRLQSYRDFDRGISVAEHPDYSMRLLIHRGKVTMHNKFGDLIGEWNGHMPELSSSQMPAIRRSCGPE